MIRGLLSLSLFYAASALISPSSCRSSTFLNPSHHHLLLSRTSTPTALFERRDASRSGTKRERMDKMAELEEDMVETDKTFVLKAAGGFVGIIVLLLIVAYATGVFDQLIMNY